MNFETCTFPFLDKDFDIPNGSLNRLGKKLRTQKLFLLKTRHLIGKKKIEIKGVSKITPEMHRIFKIISNGFRDMIKTVFNPH